MSSKGLVAAGSDDGTVVVYDPAAKPEAGGEGTAAAVYTGRGHTDFVRAVVWRDETTLGSGGGDGQILDHTVASA